jgi:hypothetical protein
MTNLDLPHAHPIPVSEIVPTLHLRIVGAAGAGWPSPAQDWEETAINLVELLRLDRAVAKVHRELAEAYQQRIATTDIRALFRIVQSRRA